MFRKLRTFLISLALVLVATIGTAFSIFYFGDLNFYINDLDQELRVDNVKENYSFGRDEELDTEYTIYLFPSSLYAVIYDDYLNKIYDDDLNNNETAIKPEEAFGYIEASLENGEVTYTPYTEGKKGYNDYKNYYEYVSSLGSSTYYVDKEDYQHSENSNSVYVVKNNGITQYYDIGDPTLPLNPKFSNDSLGDDDQNMYLNRNQFRYDRFGAWENLDALGRNDSGAYDVSSKDMGRYLPQKLVVRQSITAEYFQTYTIEPITSMGDSHGWYNLTFSSWTSFSINKKASNYERPYINDGSIDFSLWPFLSGDISSYFDIMRNLEIYADDSNVLRLFPYFSNGKHYETNVPSYGGRDALKIVYSSPDSDNNSEKYFMYNNIGLTPPSNYELVNNVYYSVLSNIRLESGLYDKFQIQAAVSSTPSAGWVGEWTNVCPNSLNIDNIVNTYGDGLYNFYFFVGNSGVESDDYEAPWWNPFDNDKYISSITDIPSYVIQNETDWGELYQKKLITIGPTNDESKFIEGSANGSNAKRPIAICIEKVSEGRLYKDLNSKYSSEGELQQVINNSYNQADNFVMYTYPIHSTTSNNNELIVGNNIVENNPYVYLLRNVNFTDVENLSFQIRFSQSYIPNTKFNLEGSGGGNPVILNPTNSNGTYSYNENQVFIPASNYFNVSAISFNDGVGTSQECFTLGDYTNKGVYDILLIYRATSGDVDEFEMYAYRHTINFIKLYKVGTNIKVDDNTGLAIHTKEDGSALDEQIWMGRANIGENLDPSNFMSSETNSSGQLISLQDALKNYLGNDSNTYSNYIVRDYVTDQIVMYYHNGAWQTDNFVILKNYLFIVEKVN